MLHGTRAHNFLPCCGQSTRDGCRELNNHQPGSHSHDGVSCWRTLRLYQVVVKLPAADADITTIVLAGKRSFISWQGGDLPMLPGVCLCARCCCLGLVMFAEEPQQAQAFCLMREQDNTQCDNSKAAHCVGNCWVGLERLAGSESPSSNKDDCDPQDFDAHTGGDAEALLNDLTVSHSRAAPHSND